MSKKLVFKGGGQIDGRDATLKAFSREEGDERQGYQASLNVGEHTERAALFVNGASLRVSCKDGSSVWLFPVTARKDGSPLTKADGTPGKPFLSGFALPAEHLEAYAAAQKAEDQAAMTAIRKEHGAEVTMSVFVGHALAGLPEPEKAAPAPAMS